MSANFKPMLAAEATFDDPIKFPVMVTPKLDGIRCVIHEGRALTRSLKPVPNKAIREKLELLPDGLDGEIIIVDADGEPLSYNDVQSIVMSHDESCVGLRYCVFDWVRAGRYDEPYDCRVAGLIVYKGPDYVVPVLPKMAMNLEDLKRIEKETVEAGYEGICFRTPDSPYKFGRSTLKQGWLLKLKRFKDAEARVIGFEERMSNQNAPVVNALGHIERPGGKAGLIPAGTLGKFVVEDLKTGLQFPISPGVLTAAERKEIWDHQAAFLGRILTYRYQPYGEKDLPRFGRFRGWRDRKDL